MMGDIFSYLYQFADVFAFLILSAAGLAIVFGMMGIINMAHGEFIMCGAYVTVGLVHTGFPLVAAQLCGDVDEGEPSRHDLHRLRQFRRSSRLGASLAAEKLW